MTGNWCDNKKHRGLDTAAVLWILRFRSGNQCLEGIGKSSLAHSAHPLIDDFPLAVKQKGMRLVAIPELPLERFCAWIVDIQVHEIDLIPPLLLEPVHDGRQGAAGRSPEGEELKQGWLP